MYIFLVASSWTPLPLFIKQVELPSLLIQDIIQKRNSIPYFHILLNVGEMAWKNIMFMMSSVINFDQTSMLMLIFGSWQRRRNWQYRAERITMGALKLRE